MRKTKLILCVWALLLSCIRVSAQNGSTYFKEFPGNANSLDKGMILMESGKALVLGSQTYDGGFPMVKVDVPTGIIDTTVNVVYDATGIIFDISKGKLIRTPSGEVYLLSVGGQGLPWFSWNTQISKLNTFLDIEWTKSWGAQVRTPPYPPDSIPTIPGNSGDALGSSRLIIGGDEHLLFTDLNGQYVNRFKAHTIDSTEQVLIRELKSSNDGGVFIGGLINSTNGTNSFIAKADSNLGIQWAWKFPSETTYGVVNSSIAETNSGSVFFISRYHGTLPQFSSVTKINSLGTVEKTIYTTSRQYFGLHLNELGPVLEGRSVFQFDFNLNPIHRLTLLPPNWYGNPLVSGSLMILPEDGFLLAGNYPGTGPGPYPSEYGPHFLIRADSTGFISPSCLSRKFPFDTMNASFPNPTALLLQFSVEDSVVEMNDSLYTIPFQDQSFDVTMTVDIYGYSPGSNGFCNGFGSSTTTGIFGFQPLALSWSNGETGIDADSLCSGLTILAYGYEHTCIVTDTIGIATSFTEAQLNPIQIELYPNPAQDYLSLATSQTLTKARLQVTDASGKVVLQRAGLHMPRDQRHQVDLAGLTPGSYFIEIHTAQHRWARPFTKN